jgi:hypothetical protein
MISSIDRKSISHNQDITYTLAHLFQKQSLRDISQQSKYSPLETDLIDSKRISTVMLEVVSNEDAYFISRVPSNYVRDIMFVKSAIPILYKFAQRLKDKQLEIVDDLDFLLAVKNTLNEIICFMFEFEYYPDIDYSSIHGDYPLNPYRQSLLADVNLIDIMFDIVHYPFHNKIYDISKLSDEFYIREIIRNSYSN